jgi:hypothetical protein
MKARKNCPLDSVGRYLAGLTGWKIAPGDLVNPARWSTFFRVQDSHAET